MCASARPVAAPNMPGWGAESLLVDLAVALACFGIEGELAAGAGVLERVGELVLEPVEVGAGEVAAERQQLAAVARRRAGSG